MNLDFRAEKPMGYLQIAAASTVAAINLNTAWNAAYPNVPFPAASLILCQAEAQAARWRDDGVNPTATIGYMIAAGGELRYTGSSPKALTFINATAGTIINVCFYGALGSPV